MGVCTSHQLHPGLRGSTAASPFTTPGNHFTGTTPREVMTLMIDKRYEYIYVDVPTQHEHLYAILPPEATSSSIRSPWPRVAKALERVWIEVFLLRDVERIVSLGGRLFRIKAMPITTSDTRIIGGIMCIESVQCPGDGRIHEQVEDSDAPAAGADMHIRASLDINMERQVFSTLASAQASSMLGQSASLSTTPVR